jgi:peptidoglycan/LPS O-acetylase OafA/YrhL
VISAGRFVIRRLARIYPAIWVATIVGVPALYLGHWIARDPDFTAWMMKYIVPPNPKQILLGLAGADNTVLMPLWTIYVELVGSFLIPLMAWLAIRGRTTAVAMIIALAVIACVAMHWPKPALPARYLVYFAIGVTLALFPSRRMANAAPLALVAGILLITVGPVLYLLLKTGQLQPATFFYQDYFVGFVEASGAALLISALTSDALDARWLRSMALQRLGERSYSLYLVHAPILVLIASALPRMSPIAAMIVLAVATAVVAIIISGLIFRYAELPGMALGKKITASPDRIFTLSRLRHPSEESQVSSLAGARGDRGN